MLTPCTRYHSRAVASARSWSIQGKSISNTVIAHSLPRPVLLLCSLHSVLVSSSATTPLNAPAHSPSYYGFARQLMRRWWSDATNGVGVLSQHLYSSPGSCAAARVTQSVVR